MGSCVAKHPEVFPKSSYPKVVSTVSLFDIDREYLRPEVRQAIFMSKDLKAPELNLKGNKLYQMRISKNEVATKSSF